MGLFNHLFGNKKALAEELAMDDNKRLALWDEHLKNYEEREWLCRNFNYFNINDAVKNLDQTIKILEQIESLISPELVSLGKEIKIDQESIRDIKDLEILSRVEGLSEMFGATEKKEKIILELFNKMFRVLKAELQLIRQIRKKPENVRELLLELFDIMYAVEARLSNVFRDKCYREESKKIHVDIMKITRAILLEEKLEKRKETDDEKFARQLHRKMIDPESDHSYRRLGEAILDKLAAMAGSPLPRDAEKYMTGIEKINKFVGDDNLLHEVIRKLRPRFDETRIRIVMNAFRSAYNHLHFEDLMSDL
jgi:hypothetical protein